VLAESNNQHSLIDPFCHTQAGGFGTMTRLGSRDTALVVRSGSDSSSGVRILIQCNRLCNFTPDGEKFLLHTRHYEKGSLELGIRAIIKVTREQY
jgi:hypothetical protein